MAVLTLNGGSISLSSSWTFTYDQDGWYKYGTPSTAYDAVTFDLTGIPEGAEIKSAVLTASRWGSGKRLMHGQDAATVNIDPVDIDRDEGLRIVFSYQANGGYKSGSGISGTMTESAGWNNITLAITYEMPYTAPTAPTAVNISRESATPGESVILSWSGAKAGNNVEITGYQVYRATAADGEYADLAETDADTLNISVTAPEAAGSYFYKVRAMGSVAGYNSALSSAYAQVSVAVTAPSAPDTLTVIPSAQYPNGSAILSFSGAAAGENNAIRGYALWRSDKADSGYIREATMESTASGGAFTVTAPQTGSLYFKVQTLGENMDGELSAAYAVLAADFSGTSDFILSSDTVDAGTNLTITLLSNTDKAHTLTASIGEYSQAIQSAAGTETIAFTPPLSWLSAMPDSETWPMLITLRTEGAGTIRKNVNLRCPDSVVPTVSGAYAVRMDNDVPSGWGVYVQGKSQAEIHLETAAVPAYGSPILRYRMEGAGANAESAAPPFSMITGMLPAGDVIITITATDARGRTGTQQLIIPVEAYDQPALKNIITLRCDSEGNEMDEGTFAGMEADLIYSPCGGHNSASVTAAYRLSGSDTWTDAGIMENGSMLFGGQMDIGQNYDIRYTLTDGLGAEVIYYDVITRAKPELHIRRGGGAWAFGGLADTDGALKVYGDLILSGGLMLGTENAGKLLYVNDNGVAQPLALGEGMYILDGVLNLGTPPWAGTPLSDLASGTLIYLMEGTDYAPYMVLAHGHHGSNLTTLIRYRTSSITSKFFASTPSYSGANKYDTSTLCAAYASFYAALPSDTQGKIEEAAIPVKANTTEGTISARMFALSEMEYTGSGSAEGTQIAYFADNASRIAYGEDGATAQYVWTRTPVGGMADYAKCVYNTGKIGNAGVDNARPLRPACCVKSDAILTKDNQGRYIL